MLVSLFGFLNYDNDVFGFSCGRLLAVSVLFKLEFEPRPPILPLLNKCIVLFFVYLINIPSALSNVVLLNASNLFSCYIILVGKNWGQNYL